ncbi:MAG: oligosaccharide flippase family protein, partial [Epsilonproteobacteria bacterium]|nr:oligosaccharide flippase family protein [Campylobacterota bacterium]
MSNFFSLSILQAFTYILPLLTLPYLVRVLGVENFGLVMFAQAFIMFFAILVDYGFNLSATREVSIHRDDKEKLTEIFSSVMSIKFILIGVSFIILSIVVFSFEKFSSHWELYYLTFLMVIGQALFPIWYFQGLERMKYITIVNITSKLIFTVAIFIFIQNEDDYILVPVLNGLGFIAGSLYSLWIVHKYFHQKFVLQTIKTIMIHFKDSSQFFLSRVSVSIYTSANAFVLGLFTDNIMVGYYSIAEKLYMAMQSLYAPITQTLYPYVAKQKNIALFKKIFYSVVFVNIIGVAFLYFFGEYIFALLFTHEIGSESIKVFHILLVANLIVVPSILIGYPFLGALGFAKYANMSVIYASIMHLLGLILLIITDNITIFSVA